MNSDIVALAKEVASCFETQTTNSFDGSLTTPITLYRTGRVLYACIPNGSVHSLITDTFDHLISSLGQDYVGMMLLHELHVAYANLIVSFSSSTPNPSVPDTSSLNLLMAQSPGYASKPTACASKDIIEATESLCGVYLASKSACQYCGSFESSESSANELDIVFASFSWVYEYILSDSSVNNMKDNVLKTVSRLLIHGIVHATNDNSEDEQISTIMNIIQRIQSSGGECSCTMGDMLQMEETSDDSFVKNLTSQFSDGPQLQYTMAMLRGFPSSSSRAAANKPTVTKASYSEQTIPNNASRQNMTDIQISHVKGVLPDLGEGFIEEALKVYNYDVERTLDALLQVAGDKSNMHPRLRTLPTNLPRKLKDLPEQYTANVNMHRGATAKDDGKEHVQRQKQYIKEVERQAEEEAYLVENVSRALGGLRVQGVKNENDDFGITGNEYDDDYDDQYDGVGNDVGGMDEGLYDVDVHNVHQKYDRGGAKNEQEMWRQYNKVIKSVDAESQFWEESRNTNRQNNNKPTKSNNERNEEDVYDDDDDDDDGEKKYRGPDKGRGGRLLGPDGKYLPIQRGGKKGRGNAGTSNDNGNAGRGGRGGRGGTGRGGRGGAGKPKTADSNAQDEKKTDGDDMSKIQKRRKNDNKAKIGNHHRKDRATKKAAGGMMH